MIRAFALAAAAALLAGLGAMWYLGQVPERRAACGTSQSMGDIGGPFELIDASGTVVTDRDVITGPSLVYFGYTFCPDVCPLHVARNADAVDLLEDRGLRVTPVFISIDPDRDTPEIVGDFAANLHERMIGLTGTAAQVEAASQAYKTYYKAHKDGTDEYLVDHSTFTYLVLPEKGVVEFFRADASAEAMASSVACFAGQG